MFPVDNKPGVFSIVAFGRYAELTTDPAGDNLYIVGEHDGLEQKQRGRESIQSSRP
jgi:hypothetical protein